MEWSWYLLIKTGLTAVIIVVVSEVVKRNEILGSLIASLPIVSVLTMMWVFGETGNSEKIIKYSTGTFWYVLPSLPMFLILPWLMQNGWGFHLALLTCVLMTGGLYFATTEALAKFGMSL
ncbi:MAG: hypothetical protein CMI32_06045 [Opitutales bacterium]|nr:hypothetical protein [Opitutales bacterium]